MAERTILNSVGTIDVYNTTLMLVLNVSVVDASVTHSLAIKRGNTTITTSTFGALSVGTQTYNVSLTSAQRTAILNAMPDVASFNATYELTSLNNGVAVGTPSAATATIKLSGGKPTVADFTWADTNPKTLAMTGDSHYIIEGESDLYFYNVSATPYTGASIAQYILGDGLSDKNVRTATGGTIHYGTVDSMNPFEEGVTEYGVFVIAQDSRRNEASKWIAVSGWSFYSRPWNSSITVTRNESDASLIDIHLSGRFHPVNGLNTVTASFKYKLSSSSTYSADVPLSVTTSNSSYSCDAIGLTGLNSSAFSEASQYDISITVSDALHDNAQSFVLPSTTPMLAFRDDAIGIGTVPQGTKRVEVAPDWSIVNNGTYEAPSSKYYSQNYYAINMNNSDIINANGIYMNDSANAKDEGIIFMRNDNGNWDTLYAYDGEAYIRRNWTASSSAPSGIRLLTADDIAIFTYNGNNDQYFWNSAITTRTNADFRRAGRLVMCYIRFVAPSTATSGQVIATIPTGYRPTISMATNATEAWVKNANAPVTITNGGAVAFVNTAFTTGATYIICATWITSNAYPSS